MKNHMLTAITDGRKKRAVESATAFYHTVQKNDAAFAGITRIYRPATEDGDRYPDEQNMPHLSVSRLIEPVLQALGEAWDTVAAQDKGNSRATADVVVDGTVLLKDVQVNTLLYLEKRIMELKDLVSKLPVLDPGETWTFDSGNGVYRTAEPSETLKTKKVHRSFTKAQATERHPEQVEVYTEDVVIGRYSVTKFSGAVPAQVKADTLRRIAVLHDAVKLARERANTIDQDITEGWSKPLFNYIFSPLRNSVG